HHAPLASLVVAAAASTALDRRAEGGRQWGHRGEGRLAARCWCPRRRFRRGRGRGARRCRLLLVSPLVGGLLARRRRGAGRMPGAGRGGAWALEVPAAGPQPLSGAAAPGGTPPPAVQQVSAEASLAPAGRADRGGPWTSTPRSWLA